MPALTACESKKAEKHKRGFGGGKPPEAQLLLRIIKGVDIVHPLRSRLMLTHEQSSRALRTIYFRMQSELLQQNKTTGALNKKSEVGNFLLSQEAALQVPSADTRLTAGFGMFPGIPTLLWSPTSLFSLPIYNMYFISFKVTPGLPRKTSLFLTPRKSLRSLVPVCSIHYCTFTSGLSSK